MTINFLVGCVCMSVCRIQSCPARITRVAARQLQIKKLILHNVYIKTKVKIKRNKETRI